MTFEHTQTLVKAGLSESQALVYEALLHLGEQKAGSLTHHLPLKRQLVYKVLDDLVAIGLAEKKEKPSEVARFLPKHPAHLRELVEGRERALREAAGVLDGLLPALVSDFNIHSSQPGVLVYEGKEGLEHVLNDSLSAKEEIYSYVDVEAVEKYMKEINARYMKKRDKLDISKKLLVPDTPFTRDLYENEKSLVTEVRFIPSSEHPFEVSMQIYDNKVSYLTLLPDRVLGVIIEDPSIYRMHRHLFEVLYSKGRRLENQKIEPEGEQMP